MSTIPNCPQCDSAYAYEDRDLFICPECGHEWNQIETEQEQVIVDANGKPLATGDTVIIVKDLKVKGSSSVVKQGTKVKNIRLVDSVDGGHDIDCKIDGFGAMNLKSEFVKKA